MKMWKSASLVLVMIVAMPAWAQQGAILSKQDAASMFALSKQSWNQNVRSGAATGAMRAIRGSNGVLKMGIRYPEGPALVIVPTYDNGDAKPSFLEVTVVYPNRLAQTFDEKTAKDVEAKSVEEMKPDYIVTALHQKSEIGFMFIFFIRERVK